MPRDHELGEQERPQDNKYEKNRKYIDEILDKVDRAPANMELFDKDAAWNAGFAAYNSVSDAKQEANMIDKILQGVSLSEETEDRLFTDDTARNLQGYLKDTGMAVGNLNLATVTGLKHKQSMDLAHVLFNTNDKTDSPEMEAVKKDVLEVALVMERNKNKEAASDVIEELDIAIHLALNSCWNYLENRRPWFKTGQKRKRMVYEVWASLLCEQQLIFYAYNKAAEAAMAGHPVKLGELFAMSEKNREFQVVRPKEGDNLDSADFIGGIGSNLGKAVRVRHVKPKQEDEENAGGEEQAVHKPQEQAPAVKLSASSEFGKRVLDPDYSFSREIKDKGLKVSAAKAEAQKVLAFRKSLLNIPKDMVWSGMMEFGGKKFHVLQKSDNSLYIIDKHRKIPVGNNTLMSISNAIENEVFHNPDMYGLDTVSQLLEYYRSDDMTGGEHLRVRQSMIRFISQKTNMVDNELINVKKSKLADYVGQLIRGERTPEDIKKEVQEEINQDVHVNAVELAELVELNKKREQGELARLVQMNEAYAQPMEAGWTEEERAVKGLVADLIFSAESWEMDKSLQSPDVFVSDMLIKHKDAVLTLLNKMKNEPQTDFVAGIMAKMELEDLGGELDGQQVKLTKVVADSMKTLIAFVETKLASFDEGGSLADKNIQDMGARLDYLFNNSNAEEKARLREEMHDQLAAVKTDMDNVVDQAGKILQQNVSKMVPSFFVQDREAKKPLEEQSLGEIIANATKTDKGQGSFIRNVLNNYFEMVSTLDKRAMLASVFRSAKQVKRDDLTDAAIIKLLKAKDYNRYNPMFPDGSEPTEEGRLAIENYRNEKLAVRKQSNLLAGLLRGAGPLLQKMMQGVPTTGLDPEIAEALKDMKTNLPPIPEQIVKTRLAAMVESSGGAVRKIELIKSLGAASVGQAFHCKVYGPGMGEGGKDVVIKLLRPEATNRMLRDQKIMLKCAEMTDPAMKATYEGQLEGYKKELDLKTEAMNCDEGVKAYKENLEKDKDEKAKDVKTMTVFKQIEPTSNALAINKSEGETLDAYIRSVKEEAEEAVKKHCDAGVNRIQMNGNNISEIVESKKQLLDKIDNAVKRRDHLVNLVNVWIAQGVCKTGFYHGDLHSGNIMINDKEATFIDYGNAVQLNVKQQECIAQMMLGAQLGVVKKYKTVQNEDGTEEEVFDEEKTTTITNSSVDLFFNAFNEMLKESNSDADNAAYTPEKQQQVRRILDIVLRKGGESDTGARISAAIITIQQIGVKIPPAMQNFSQGQMRLQNSIDELNGAIEKMKAAAGTLDHAEVEHPGGDPILIVQNKAQADHARDSGLEAGDIFRRIQGEMDPLNEEEFTKAILDNTYIPGSKRQGIRPVDKRREFLDKYFNGILNLKTRFNELDDEDKENYEDIRQNARGWITEYLGKYKGQIGSAEQKKAALKLAGDLMLLMATGNVLDFFGGMKFFSQNLNVAVYEMDEGFLNDYLDVVENLFPLAMDLQSKLVQLRNEQDGDANKKPKTKEELMPMAKEIYKDMNRLWEFNRKRNYIREEFVAVLQHCTGWTDKIKEEFKPLTSVEQDGIGAALAAKIDELIQIMEPDIKIVKNGPYESRTYEKKPEHAQAYLQAKNEMLDLAMKAARIRMSDFTQKMHGKKINYKHVNFDKVMDDVLQENQNELRKKIGTFTLVRFWKMGAFSG